MIQPAVLLFKTTIQRNDTINDVIVIHFCLFFFLYYANVLLLKFYSKKKIYMYFFCFHEFSMRIVKIIIFD